MSKAWSTGVAGFSLAAILAGFSNPVRAQAPSPEIAPLHPRICLVLSGGGARGATHVGVLEALQQLHIPVDCIAGTSSGAIVGGLYAAGLGLQQLQAALLTPDMQASMANQLQRDMLTYTEKQQQLKYIVQAEFGYADGKAVFPQGIIAGNDPGRILNMLTLLTSQNQDFSKLPIPFKAVATDIDTGKMVVLDHGNLADALRASMSVPGVYPPVRFQGHTLVDGGLARNLPVGVARDMGADVVIAVDVGTPLTPLGNEQDVVSVSVQVLKIFGQQNVTGSEALLRPQDVLLKPDLGDITATDFQRMGDAIRIGRQTTLKALQSVKSLQLSPQAYALYAAAHRYIAPVIRHVDFIEISGNQHISSTLIRSHLVSQPGDAWDMRKIDQDMKNLYHLGYFSRVQVAVLQEGERTGLSFKVTEKNWHPNYFRFGIRIADDLEGSSQYDLLFGWTRAELDRLGGEWRNELEIGKTRRIYSELYQPVTYSGTIFVAPQVEYSNDTFDLFSGENRIAEYSAQLVRGGLDVGNEFGNSAELRVGLSYGHVVTQPRIGDSTLPIYRDTLSGVRVRFGMDTLEGDTGFPMSGSYMKLTGFFARSTLGSDISYDKLELSALHAFGDTERTLILSADAGSSFGSQIPVYDEFTLGGFLSLSGLRQQQLRGQKLLDARVIYLNRLANLPSVLGNGFYFGASLEAGNVWDNTQKLDPAQLKYGAALFLGADTALGPLYLGAGFSQGGNQSLYLYLGLPFD
ncbi:MAG TPA: patatin-like phospholipase family protein [Gammaproteobacteria bacterium]|nr:patatin-like phospholipase family protein [Gammaproteobacteria bacterium]